MRCTLRRHAAFCALTAAATLTISQSLHADVLYNGSNTVWNAPASWLPAAVPTTGDTVDITPNVPASPGVNTLSLGSYTTPSLAAVSIGSTGLGTMTLNVDSPSSILLLSGLLDLGSVGAASLEQTGSTSTVRTGSLTIGDAGAAATYDQKNGTLFVLNTTAIGAGQGTLNAAAGTTYLGAVHIGSLSGGTGLLNVAGGTVAASSIDVGIGSDQSLQGNGSITISAGSLAASSLLLSSHGSLLQTGGLLTVGNFDASNAASFSFQAGQLNIAAGQFRAPQSDITATFGDTSATFTGSFAVSASTLIQHPIFEFSSGGSLALPGPGQDDLIIAVNGRQGTVFVMDAGTIVNVAANATPGSGTVEVGAGAIGGPTFHTFASSTGSLAIAQGGVMQADTVNVGDHGGTGTVTISGPGSALSASTVNVGFGHYSLGTFTFTGSNTLAINGGGTLAVSGTLSIGNSGGTGSVSIIDLHSSLSATNLVIGDAGRGSLNVSWNTTVSASHVTLGQNGGTGTITLDNNGGSALTFGSLDIGDAAPNTTTSASLTLNGSSLTVSGATIFHPGTQSLSLTLSNGTFSTHDLDLSGVDNFSWTGGAMILTGGDLTGVTTLNARSFTGSGTVHANLVTKVFAPTSHPGLLHVLGNFSLLTDGQLQNDIFGSDPSQYERLQVDGNLSLTGFIYLYFQYTPHLGDSFQLFSFNSFTDGGYTLSAQLPTGLTLDTSALATTGVVTIVPEPASCLMMSTAILLCMRRPRRRFF